MPGWQGNIRPEELSHTRVFPPSHYGNEERNQKRGGDHGGGQQHKAGDTLSVGKQAGADRLDQAAVGRVKNEVAQAQRPNPQSVFPFCRDHGRYLRDLTHFRFLYQIMACKTTDRAAVPK